MWMEMSVRWSPHQGFVLHVLSQQAVVIQGVLGLAGHSVHWAFIHLVLYGPEQHVKRLPCRVLHKGRGKMKKLEGAQSHREFFTRQGSYFHLQFLKHTFLLKQDFNFSKKKLLLDGGVNMAFISAISSPLITKTVY